MPWRSDEHDPPVAGDDVPQLPNNGLRFFPLRLADAVLQINNVIADNEIGMFTGKTAAATAADELFCAARAVID